MGKEVAKVSLHLLLVVIGLLLGRVAVADEAPSASPLPIGLAAGRSDTVEVRHGDHLWSISETRLEGQLGPAVPDEVVSRYWRQVVRVNAGRMRSGDPDLIYPGETVILPPVR